MITRTLSHNLFGLCNISGQNRYSNYNSLAILILYLFTYTFSLAGNKYFVSPEAQDGKGTLQSPMSMEQVNSMAQPGDIILLLDGEYDTPIEPKNSGTKGPPDYLPVSKQA